MLPKRADPTFSDHLKRSKDTIRLCTKEEPIKPPISEFDRPYSFSVLSLTELVTALLLLDILHVCGSTPTVSTQLPFTRKQLP